MRPHFVLFVSLMVLASPVLAQDRGLLLAGLNARITQYGMRAPDTNAIRDTTIAFYPDARFYVLPLALGNGGTTRVYEAIGADGELYLLDSPASFRLLHAKYFRGTVDSTIASSIGLLAARFGGLLPEGYHLFELTASRQYTLMSHGAIFAGWRTSVKALVHGRPVSVAYDIDPNSGLPTMAFERCEVICRVTIMQY